MLYHCHWKACQQHRRGLASLSIVFNMPPTIYEEPAYVPDLAGRGGRLPQVPGPEEPAQHQSEWPAMARATHSSTCHMQRS